jgi:AAA+ superfamily predicted ATPase
MDGEIAMNQTQALETLDRYIRAKYPVICIISHEEPRVMAGIRAIAAAFKNKKAVIEWSLTSGMFTKATEFSLPDAQQTRNPVPAFEIMLDPSQAGLDDLAPSIFVMKDLHGALGNKDHGFEPLLTRYLRDVANVFSQSNHTLILLSPAFQIPPDLEKTIVMIDWPLPDVEELGAVLNKIELDLPENYPVTLNGNRERVIQAMRGLTVFEAESVLLSGIVATKGLGDNIIPFIVKEKAQIIKKAGVLEYFDTDVTMSQVGGLAYLKKYAQIKRRAFAKDAAEFGVDAPKGVLLVGIPGTGKSLAAKAIAGGQMPLLRMDVGALMGGLVGQSESNMRAALKVAEAVAPAVLWIDELEKALGSGGGELDGGTSARVFGTLLTWMQETAAPVYVVATANDIRGLRPELIRRFDDMFWVDLPCLDDRIEILKVHLAKRHQDPFQVDTISVAAATWGFSGGEIEKVVKSALETAFFDGVALSTQHLTDAAAALTPIAVTMEAQIKSLRDQAKNARQAGERIEPKPVEETKRKIDLS